MTAHFLVARMMIDTRNEPSFAEIGQKLTCVIKKYLRSWFCYFFDRDLFISLIFCNRYMVNVDKTLDFKSRDLKDFNFVPGFGPKSRVEDLGRGPGFRQEGGSVSNYE